MNGTRSLPRATVYPMSYRVVGTVADVIIFIVGFLGNIMICAVVKNTKSLQTPTYCYLVSLAVADILLVCAAIPEAIISYHLYSKQWILGHAGCAIMVFITFLAINAGSLSILAFTIERYIAICHPMLAQKVCTVSRARNIILTTWAIVCLYSAPWLGLSGTRPLRLADVTGMEKCDYLLSRDMYIYFFLFDVVVFYCVPLLISVILYLRMGLVLHKSMQDLRKQIGTRMPLRGWSMRKSSSCTLENPPRNCASMSRGASTKNPPKWLSVPGDESRTGPSTQRDTQTANATMQSRCQVVKMLIVVVVCFAVLWLPYRGLLVYNSLVSKPWLNMWYVLFAKTLVVSYYVPYMNYY
ncbi:hypothetical protein RvY_09846-2 [Ramazzottius varieornatus]|uniref:Thyrotropin-releasing hormone receptor n=1 Tax=Ramazzottius varieornatus TaxID=947166 RepID=A0A1D1VJR3_RAMVA|nr:hypothetical protein RvY_09846-2 [Ramazzottius varieornatus]